MATTGLWRDNMDNDAWEPRNWQRLHHKCILACGDLRKELNDAAYHWGRRLRYGSPHLCVPEEFLDLLEIVYRILERITHMHQDSYLPDFAEFHRRDILDMEHFVDLLRRYSDDDALLKDLEKVESRIQKLDNALHEFSHLVPPTETTHAMFRRLCREGFFDGPDKDKDTPGEGSVTVEIIQPMES